MSTADDTRIPLTRRRVLEAALRLVDERGLDALTMRALGSELGVEAMSLYRHVPGKDAVLDGVLELLLEELTSDDAGPDADWRDCMATYARAHRALAARHPRAVGLLGRDLRRTYLAAAPDVQAALGALVEAGLEPSDAILAFRALSRYVTSLPVAIPGQAEEAPRMPPAGAENEEEEAGPLARALLDGLDGGAGSADALFEFGVEMLLDGIAARLSTSGARRP